MSPYCTVALSAEHDRADFDCGSEPLNRYLRQLARQDRDRHMARVYVCCAPDSAAVVGYYTLSAFAVWREALPAPEVSRLGRHAQVPAVLIGRLAVDLRAGGQGLGAALLIDALRRARDAADVAAAAVVVVHAKDGAAAFYERHGFRPFVDAPSHLFLPMKTVVALLAGVELP